MAAPTPAENGNSNILDELTSKAPPGTTLPPRNIRDIVEKTAGYIVRNGPDFVNKIMAGQGSNPKMSFLFPEDAYHPYYQWRLAEIGAGRGNIISAGRGNESSVGASMKGREVREKAPPPEDFRFSARMPNISAQDLEVVKLTALFVAKNGRAWMTALSQREAGNFQFDFLRPQHTLFQFFSRLLDQYTELLASEGVDEGQLSTQHKKRIEELEACATDRFHVLNRARRRAEWLKRQEAAKTAQAEQDEKEKLTYAQIDWHDFVIVETVVFDERDEQADLPAPTSLNDLQSASLEQKAAMRIGSGRRIEEAMPGMEDWDAFYGGQNPPQQQQQHYQQSAAVAHAASAPAVQMPLPPQPQAQQPYPTPQQQPLKIRDASYVPRAQIRKPNLSQLPPNTSLCAICGDAFLNNEISEHMRIEMLDPNWREQYEKSAARSAATNLHTQDASQHLKRLASQRSDVFVRGSAGSGGEDGGGIDEEERKRRKRAEMGQYDGVSGVPSPAALAGMVAGAGSTAAQAGMGLGGAPGAAPGAPDVQEQIRLLHQRYGG